MSKPLLPAVSMRTAPIDGVERFLRSMAGDLRAQGMDTAAAECERHANALSREIEQAHAFVGAVYTPDDIYLPVKGATGILGVTDQTMRIWRIEGYGPAYIQPQRRVLYPLSEITKWLRDQPRYRSTSEAQRAAVGTPAVAAGAQA